MRRLPLTETSWIILWCSRSHGIIKTVAKGARRPKSPMAGRLDLFFSCDIAWVAARRSDLHVLCEVVPREYRSAIRGNYLRTLAASYFMALVEMVVEKDTPVPEFHQLLERALDYLERQVPELKGLLHFELEVARLLGILEGGTSGAEAICRAYHRLPAMREGLWESLRLVVASPGVRTGDPLEKD